VRADRRPARALTALVLVGAITACAPTPTSSSDPTGGLPDDVALSCWSVDDAECRTIFEAALARLPADRPPVVAARVTAFSCESGPCAPGMAARGQGEVQVEFGQARGLVAWPLTLADGGVAFGPPLEAAGGGIMPASTPAAAPIAELSLGHCGLFSPIDFDASFWDPIGWVDGDAAEAINSASGTIRLLGPVDAEFRAESGFTVRLRRHGGAKTFQGCM